MVRLDRRQGLAALPNALVALFQGGNDGTLVVINDPAPGHAAASGWVPR